MTNLKKMVMVMLLVLICSVSFVFAQPVAETSDIVKVIYTNDIHAGYKGDIGYAGLAALVKETRENWMNVTLIDNGDAIQGEAIGTVSNGEYLVKIMNEIGYDFTVFGNHEFDYSMDQLQRVVGLSNSQYLACNINYVGNGRNKLAQAKAYEIVNYGNYKVAYIGVSTPESIVKSTPKYFMEDGEYVYKIASGEELYAEVQYYVDQVRSLGADYVVVICHLGVEEESAPNRATDLIANTTGIDAVLDGHSHTVAAQEIYKNKDGKKVVYSQTGTKLANVGVMTIDLAKGTFKTELVQPTEKDPETEAFIATIDAEYETLVKAKVAESKIDLYTTREDGTRAVRNRETAIGDLAADAYRIVGDADVGFSNGGGIRANILAGDLSREDIINVFPFGNALTVVECSGQEILDALEWGSRATTKDASENGKALGENGGFLQVSGLKYTIDTSIASTCVEDALGMFGGVTGERRVKNVLIGSDEKGWSPIDPNGTYTLSCHNYKLKNCGDGFNMFADNKILKDEIMIDNQMLITYIVDYLNGVISEEYAKPQGRITIL